MKNLSMICFIYDIVKEEDGELNFILNSESAFITNCLESALAPYKVFPCSRINFICKESNPRETPLEDATGSIYDMEVKFNKEYFQWNDEKKKTYLFALAKECMKKLFEYYHIDYVKFSLITDTLTKLETQGPFRYFFSKKSINKKSLNGITASLCFENNMKQTVFYIELKSKKIGTKYIEFFTTGAHHCTYTPFLGELKWKDENTLCLIPAFIPPHNKSVTTQYLDVTEYRKQNGG